MSERIDHIEERLDPNVCRCGTPPGSTGQSIVMQFEDEKLDELCPSCGLERLVVRLMYRTAWDVAR